MARPAVLVLAALLVAAVPASASTLPTRTFTYDAKQVPLQDVLRDFAGAEGLPIVIADNVTGTVNAKFQMTPRGFLDLISRSFGLIWYFDGAALYVYPSSQVRSRLFKLTGSAAATTRERLLQFGLLDDRYPVKFLPVEDGTLVFAAGPPRHIDLLEALITAIRDADQSPSPETMRTFKLVHASVVDRTVLGVKVPGVLTTLTNLYGTTQGGADPRSAASSLMAMGAPIQEQLLSQSKDVAMAGPEVRHAIQPLVGPTGESPQSPSAPVPASPSLYEPLPAAPHAKPGPVQFAADEGTNLLIVRAPADQMDAIARLVGQLDVTGDMIEVQASIIDVSSDEMASLGFDWQFNANGSQVQISPATTTSTVSGAIPQGDGFNVTTLLSSGGRALLSRIRALEGHGQARVVSQPKVLVAANRTAVLADTRTASVRVAGNQDAKLYSVETGTQLQVTPRLIHEATGDRISLEIAVQDGGFSSDAVDSVPIAQRASISTVATLDEGQALLVGGISVDGSSSGRSGIPLLSKVPVLGALFRFDSSQASHRQRLFLITPRLVRSSVADQTPPEVRTP